MPSRRRFAPTIAACLGLALTVSGCASPIEPEQPGGSPTPSGAADGLLTTARPVTVLDDGSGAELCLGGVATSYPPQCGGPVLESWDWADHKGDFEEASGVRWGDFIIAGHYDGESGTFTPTEVSPRTDYDREKVEDTHDIDFSAPCPAPEGGWRVLDEERTTETTMDRVTSAARKLDGYAGLWLDQSPNPSDGDPEQPEEAMNDPRLTIINVRVTGDPAAAEAELRKVWGGMLCVTKAEHTSAELSTILDEIMDLPEVNPQEGGIRGAHSMLHSGVDEVTGVIELGVIYDDGSLQREFDERYGAGLVRVSSELRPVST
ncbi:hypothetical protein J4H92_11885 [Leucobacter weissii]|uniref:Uncharacterized protein n=1 Tax=Leucobacter weissii TaxID=1983706 RepID=A0A939MQA8_9MICO|nr:hypothetical protein [Leucobacter weissii]MBO1902646.1 hypothetical protein [Leucobacter weissii]